jgi:hypothetical protein
MSLNIEDTLVPATATEVALLERISQLRRKLWEGSRYFNTVDMMPPDPNEVPITVKDFNPTLRLAGASEASLDIPRGVRVEAHTYGPTSFGVANYISSQELSQLRPEMEANLLVHLHDRMVRSVGNALLDKLRQ